MKQWKLPFITTWDAPGAGISPQILLSRPNIKPKMAPSCEAERVRSLLFMRQKRFQKGSVRPRKHGKNKVWVAQWWEEDRRKKSKVLGRCGRLCGETAGKRMTSF